MLHVYMMHKACRYTSWVLENMNVLCYMVLENREQVLFDFFCLTVCLHSPASALEGFP